MGAVTAKVFLSNRVEQGEDVQLSFYADYADGRNKEWARLTPTLSLSMSVKKEVADKHFPVGSNHFTLTFEAHEKEVEDSGSNATA